MLIIQITASYKPAYVYGGPIQSIAHLCEALHHTIDHKQVVLEVLTTRANGKNELAVEPKKPQQIDGVNVRYFNRLTKDHSHFSPTLLLHLRHLLKKSRKDHKQVVVHVHAWWNLVSVLSVALAKRYQVPVILSPRGMLSAYSQSNKHSFWKQKLQQYFGQKLLAYCHFHATSGQEKTEIESQGLFKSIRVIPNLRSNHFQFNGKTTLNRSSSFRLLFLSRMEQKKGLELLFDALSTLYIEWQLTLAGSGDADYLLFLKEKASKLKISERLNWVGHVADQDKFNLMAEHDLLVLTSYNENFANVVIESLQVGTAVLISKQVGLADYILTHQFGWVCNLNPTDICEKITAAYHNQKQLLAIRQLAPEKVNDDFSSAALVKQYLDFYRSIIS